MAEYKLGKIALTPKGEYNSQTNYTKLDLVEYEGSGYVNIYDCVGILPTNTYNWMRIVKCPDEEDIQAATERAFEEVDNDLEKIGQTLNQKFTLSDKVEQSDITKQENANSTIKILYFNEKPSDNHRYIITYLYHVGNDRDFWITIKDYDIINHYLSILVENYHFKGDTISDIVKNNQVIGKIYCSTNDYIDSVNDGGESGNRFPYLSPICYEISQNNYLASILDDNANAVESLERTLDDMQPTILLSDNIEPSDTAKCAAGNKEIKALYLKNKPATGHRVVLTYLYNQAFDNTWYYSLVDYNTSNGTETIIVNSVSATDKELNTIVDGNGNELGYIQLDSDYYTLIANQGEGTARMPYLGNDCYSTEKQSVINNTLVDDRLSDLEKKTTDKVITIWGDSITWGSGSSDNEHFYVKVLQTMLTNNGYSNISVKNCGVGGDNMISILVREGGSGLYINKDITIPASSSSNVVVDTYTNYTPVEKCVKGTALPSSLVNLMLQGDEGRGDWSGTNKTVNPIMVKGIPCIWEWVSTDGFKEGYYTLAVQESQSSDLTLKANTLIYPHGNQTKGDIVVLSMGTNGGFNGDENEYIRLVDLAIEAADTNNYIVCSPYGGTCFTEMGGKTGMETLENACMQRYGARYFNWRKFMMYDAFEYENISPTSADRTAVNQGKCPPSFLADEVHPNNYGHDAIAKKLYEIMDSLGYLN